LKSTINWFSEDKSRWFESYHPYYTESPRRKSRAFFMSLTQPRHSLEDESGT